MARGLSRRRLQWIGATKGGQGSFTFQPIWIVTGYTNKYGSSLSAHPKPQPESLGVLPGELLKHGVQRLDLVFQSQPALRQNAQCCRQCLQQRRLAQGSHMYAAMYTFLRLGFQQAFAYVLRCTYQQASQLIYGLRFCLDSATASY